MSGAWDWGPTQVRAHVAVALPEVGAVGMPRRVTGGLLNVVWRVPTATQSVIAKVAPPFVAALPDIPLDPGRQRIEAAALRAFGEDGPLAALAAERARPPRLLHDDVERSVVLMEDAGELPGLGDAVREGLADPEGAGARLGRFIGRLHAAPLPDDLRTAFVNLDAQRTRLAVQYRAVGEALRGAGVADADALGAEAVALGERLLGPGRCLIHGDLWPPSVLVAETGALRVIDWELAHVGVPAQDLGHLAAHLWMLGHRNPDTAAAATAAWAGFLGGYADGAGPALPDLLADGTLADAARHLGCEVLVRAVGPFQDGSLYDRLPLDEPVVREAAALAASAIRSPDRCRLLDPLR